MMAMALQLVRVLGGEVQLRPNCTLTVNSVQSYRKEVLVRGSRNFGLTDQLKHQEDLRVLGRRCQYGSANLLGSKVSSFPTFTASLASSFDATKRMVLPSINLASLLSRHPVRTNSHPSSKYDRDAIGTLSSSCTSLLPCIIRVCIFFHLIRIWSLVQEFPPVLRQSVPAVGLMAFALWGLDPSVRQFWSIFVKRDDSSWEKSHTHQVLTIYMRPLMFWAGIITMCRVMDQLKMQSEESQAIKQRSINFVRSLSTVLVFTFCTGSLTQQVQKYMMKRSTLKDSRNISVQFIGNAVYTSIWVAAVCLFLELLGFSTHKWLAAGGFGTVLLTLAGREIFTNFLSSMMIHATKPFVESEWIQTKIEGQEVQGTVEHVGWWSPTIIRGDDREAVHIPNHKFYVSVVRNLTQKTHWRIKTHIGISHLDVHKINGIVADMRKVLAHHPQIEQKRLHRRVFFDHMNPKNLALLIMVSCFVKTSRFEEYLRVKEAVLLDLLKVVAYHNARLATPVRSIQRVMDESEVENVSYDRTQAQPVLLNGETVMKADYDHKDSPAPQILDKSRSLQRNMLRNPHMP